MTEPSAPRPVPGPPRPATPDAGQSGRAVVEEAATARAGTSPAAAPFADLERLPVAEHVAVFEAEHARLQRELSTIDQL